MALYQCPRRNALTEPLYSADTLWIDITEYEVERFTNNPRSSAGVELGSPGDSYRFVAPNELALDFKHDWADYETMAEKAKAVISGGQKTLGEGISAVKNVTGTGSLTSVQSTSISAKGIEKIDKPMVYQGSQRRNFALSFVLAAYENPRAEVHDIVQKLSISGTGPGGGISSVDSPYVYRLSCFNGTGTKLPIFYVDAAAMLDMNVKYSGHYINGYPVRADIAISFTEIRPLYKELLEGSYSFSVTVR